MPLQAVARGNSISSKEMRVKVQFHGILSDWMGGGRAEIFLPEGSNFGDLLREIKRGFSATMPAQLRDKDQEAFNRSLWAMKGKERLSELDTALRDGDEIQLFLSLAGG